MATMQWKNDCCNPFNCAKHNVRSKSRLRTVTKRICEKFPSVLPGDKICDSCRKKLSTVSKIPQQVDVSTTYTCSSPDLPDCSSESSPEKKYEAAIAEESREKTNEYLNNIGMTPITKRKLQSKKYQKSKVETITQMLQKVGIDEKTSDDGEIVTQLKEKFSTANRSEKVQILTVLPRSWSIRKIQTEFGASNFTVRKAKALVASSGILTTPNPKPGRSLPQVTRELVSNFYEDDENSRLMPGKKDCISVRKPEGRVTIQKRLVLTNLRELYRSFKDKHLETRVGFSKFAELRPPNCVLAGASGTHSVCVCTIHQNVKLLFESIKLFDLKTSDDLCILSYQHCIAQSICNPPTPSCYFGKCSQCPGHSSVEVLLQKLLDDNMIDNVTFKQWVSVDRSTLETFTKTSDDFVEYFCDKLLALIPHSFVATQQSSYYTECKLNLKTGEVVVQADFSENYAFTLQDAAQGFHWNNCQATVHPFVVYFCHSQKEHHLSFIVISDCLLHDTIAVYLFQKRLIAFLKQKLPFPLKKITYFSDGAASQYKNRKNFNNLCHHELDFGVKAEWHFSATSHGKGACDGLGGTVKRQAARASLQRPYHEQIMTPLQLYDWASSTLNAINFTYCTTAQYSEVKDQLETRFSHSRTIPGTRQYHSYITVSSEIVAVRRFSRSTFYKEERVCKHDGELEVETVSGYVTCMYNNNWWLAFVLDLDTENSKVKVTFLHPQGPARLYRYPTVPDVLTVPLDHILTKVDPVTATGRTHTLKKKENRLAAEKLAAYI